MALLGEGWEKPIIDDYLNLIVDLPNRLAIMDLRYVEFCFNLYSVHVVKLELW